MKPETFRELMSLDVLTHRALQKSKNGLSENMRALSIKETDHPDFFTTQVPEYFDILDVRKPADLYVKDKLNQVIRDCFAARQKVEKKMTRAELNAFDRVLARYLQKDTLMPKLRSAITHDYDIVEQGKTLVNHAADNEKNLLI
jgi:hypothetical protein